MGTVHKQFFIFFFFFIFFLMGSETKEKVKLQILEVHKFYKVITP